MTTDASTETVGNSSSDQSQVPLPTTPCSVVWSGGHAYVLERSSGRAYWSGIDDEGRPCFLSDADLQRRGWHYPHQHEH